MMDILKRIDQAQQFCKFYADGAYSVETAQWNHHINPEFIEDIRQYIESLQLKLMHLQTQQAEPVQERITHITWDGRGVRTVNGIPDDAPQRKELSASEILNMMPSAIPAEYDGPLMEFARAVEAKLKERNA
jgi:hypothetical protein